MGIPIVISSPLRGDYLANLNKVGKLSEELINLNYAPLAVHFLYVVGGFLDDAKPQDRIRGIKDTITWMKIAKRAIFMQTPNGDLSSGCKTEKSAATVLHIPHSVLPWKYTHEQLKQALYEIEDMYRGQKWE